MTSARNEATCLHLPSEASRNRQMSEHTSTKAQASALNPFIHLPSDISFFQTDRHVKVKKTHLSQILVLISSKDLGTQGTCTCIYPA